ncbi:TPA: ead/Ea22-like family protein [Klebsiella pneumoniae]|uniref:ead/Ea22-like family protein n=1 Tax=Klebsiella pneumoniae TaxID=573 RepID=UPI001232D7B0|nr:ead/Ea22-like family protein [Klebsiella pneumoniae]MCQ8668437.1 ead/Ea22-like family protein [Klebsiella pneumoniae]MDR5624413.1 ead/Ea22-like family protein [Klebsiella pneumoniae]QER47680.1 ead/Ea22-like family protein [Klebsiella pneumoniae]WMY01038.1 ead/Ea22-like family protein [Klebsiella pneumoniae]WPI36441.1 ead/Ea22-like family protein [Klebsiella pneumoniae]
MTDITELAQRLKAAAEKATQGNWRAFQYHDGRCGIGGGHNAEIMVCEHISKERPHDAMFIALANPANVLALVEALEKAQQRIDSQREYYEGVIADGGKRIAELESRTVKLPDLRQIVSGDRYVWSDGVYNYSQDVKVALAAAGIKVEAE